MRTYFYQLRSNLCAIAFFGTPISYMGGGFCIICVSLWAEIYTRIPDMYPAGLLCVVL